MQKNEMHFIHTLAEIKAHFPNLPIQETWDNKNLAILPLHEVEKLCLDGQISDETMDAYSAIWRNTVPRLTSTLITWEF